MRPLAILVAALAFGLGLSACDPGPRCTQYSTHTTILPVFNGKTTTSRVFVSSVCVQYEK